MCCGSDEVLDLPAAVIEMLARYQGLLVERGWDWGDDRVEMFRWARFGRLGDVFAAYAAHGDWARAVRSVVGDDPPAGVVVVRAGADSVSVVCGRARPLIVGCAVALDVVLDSALDRDVEATVAGHAVRVPAGGAGVVTIDAHTATDLTVTVEGRSASFASAVRPVAAARLRLRSPRCSRWSVTDSSGGAWFPAGTLRKWDVEDRPFFHTDEVELDVPAEELTVVCARGMEYDVVETRVHPEPGAVTAVDRDPPRLFDPAAAGWYGGDLHIHMNYSGDLVCTPDDVARMQRGEGLHLANLVAGNLQTSLVYDREMLEEFAGTDLPWSGGQTVARMGVEYRNDLLGHVHALGPDGPPRRYATGHERSEHPEDWPPNSVACAELRALHATVGYPHPVFAPFDADGSVEGFFANPRSVEARELVVDAALGLVDSVDVLSPFDDEGAVHLYHQLLSCGIRLAATAGTDTFLSFSHGPGVASNPPGWARVYAHLGDRPLSVESFKAAIRDGHTMVTNGPWLTFSVAGHGPGELISARLGERLEITAEVRGAGIDQLCVVGPDGVVAQAAEGPLTCTVEVDGPTWLAAAARGPGGRTTLDRAALAHCTPVYIDVDGAPVARRAAAQWCLTLIDGLQQLITEHGTFRPDNRERSLAGFADLLEEGRRYYRAVRDTAPR